MEDPSPYHPLASSAGEIRLLVLEPAPNHHDPIICHLQSAFLNTNPDFEALSYVWGSKGIGGTILLDGKPHSIFENAEAALRRLRLPHRPRTIWVDAICINQSDIQERQAQVRLMGSIYRQARQVCVWLGEATAGSPMGMKALAGSVLRAAFSSTSPAEKAVVADALNIPFWDIVTSVSRIMYAYESVINEPSLSEVCELLNRPWWTRAWTMQECVLASQIVFLCGGDTVDWDTVAGTLRSSMQGRAGSRGVKKMYGVVLDQGNHTVAVAAAYEEMARLRDKRAQQTPDDSTDILGTLYNFRHLSVMDPRDRIYAFLGLAPPNTAETIAPKYESSVADAYKEFAITMIRNTGSLDVLNCVREWKTVTTPDKPAAVYSRPDQARYFDLSGVVADSPSSKARYGWVRLPYGWERVWDPEHPDEPARYLNHLTGEMHDTSPVAGMCYAVEPLSQHRLCSRGWTKTWDNLGRSQLSFSLKDDGSKSQVDAARDEELRAELHALPSWVPVWATATHVDPRPLLYESSSSAPGVQQSPNYCASGQQHTSAALHIVMDDKGGLVLEGSILVDVIVETGTPWHPDVDAPPISRRWFSDLQSWEEVALRGEESPYDATVDGGRAGALWRTYIADYIGSQAAMADVGRYMRCWYDEVNWSKGLDGLFRTFDYRSAGPAASSASIEKTTNTEKDSSKKACQANVTHPNRLSLIWRKQWILWKNLKYYRKMRKQDEKEAGNVDRDQSKTKGPRRRKGFYKELILRIYHACAHRALFRTQKGYIGLMPWNAEAGDEVWVLPGGKTPFILRPTDGAGSDEKVYQLVGEAYVQGIMGGEVLDWKEAVETKTVRII